MLQIDQWRQLRFGAAVMAVSFIVPVTAWADDPTPDPAEPPFIGTAPIMSGGLPALGQSR
jgi:hypothetical protein